jgi:hypothetical protein
MIETQQCPQPVLEARQALSQALASNPGLSLALVINEALCLVEDVHPPYLPLPEPAAPPPPNAIQRASSALDLAIALAESPKEAVRLGLAARGLREAIRGEMA